MNNDSGLPRPHSQGHRRSPSQQSSRAQQYYQPAPGNPAAWAIPSPPHSISGIASVTPAASAHQLHTINPDARGNTSEMSTLGYMMPSHYNPLGIDETSMGSSGYMYSQGYRAPAPQQPDAQAYGYSQAVSASSDPAAMYHNTGSGASAQGGYSVGQAQTPGSMPRTTSGSRQSAALGSVGRSYSAQYDRSPGFYDPNMYGSPMPAAQTPAMAPQAPASMSYPSQLYSSPPPQSHPRSMSNASAASSSSSVRVLNQKPKPQCWEHGCNGREFSTFSNLLRHQREKSGSASKSYCPKCGAEFTRTTARNGHLAHDKCSKQRRSFEER